MKKSIKTIAASLVVAIAAFAPVRSHAIDFGIRAGLDVTVPGGIKSNGASVDMFKAGCGFHAGVVADIDLVSNLFLEPGMYLVYHNTGTDIQSDAVDGIFSKVKADIALRQFGLQIPVRLGYNFKNAKEFGIDSDPYNEEITRFNMGWNLGAGVVVSRFYIGADYTFGLNDRYKDDDGSWKQGCFAVSIGYYL